VGSQESQVIALVMIPSDWGTLRGRRIGGHWAGS